jgi:TolB protein
MKSLLPLLSLSLTLPFLLNPATAQITVDKTARVSVAVTPLTGNASATSVLTADLERTSMITTSSASARYTASGSFNGSGLSGKLIDQSTKTAVLTKTYSGDWRNATHEFADDITLATTGITGFATSKVAFIAADSGTKELHVMDIDGANVRRLTQDKTISNGPAWNREGTKIAYTSYKSGYPDVYIINLTGSLGRTRVAFFPGLNAGPNFSPDGSQLALTLSKDNNPEIYTIPVGGGVPTRLTKTRGSETSPCWSPSGEKIVYCSDERGSPALYIMNSDGSVPQRLATNSGNSTSPDWSPDGKLIAYSALFGSKFMTCVYDIASGKATQVSNESGEDPSWTRNSRHVVVANRGRLAVLDTVTQRAVPLDNNLTKCSEPAVSR